MTERLVTANFDPRHQPNKFFIMADKMDVSSPESSGENITTPKDRSTTDSSALSPPDSQQRNMPLSASGASLANSNGKRPIQTISNGSDEVEGIDCLC